MRRTSWSSVVVVLALLGCGDKASSIDSDGDGFSAEVDCDDGDVVIFPGAVEVCDGLDNDCDGLVDDDASDGTVYAIDFDGDGYGSPALSARYCTPPDSGFVADATDCNDLEAAAYPGGEEVCDEVDNDCNGEVDDSAADLQLFYYDGDGDGYGNPAMSSQRCAATDGYVESGGDCDDTDAEINPETRWFPDLDGDGYGSDYFSVVDCEAPDQHVLTDADCDDEDALIFPGAAERCNGLDDDCDGGLPADDLDDDGDGSPTCAGDCDDSDSSVFPGAAEVCDGVLDNDCDGRVDNQCPTSADDADIIVSGEVSSDSFGYGMAVGDLDGDGASDLAVGAIGADGGGSSSGQVYVLKGPLSVGALSAASDADVTVVGETSSDYLGTLVETGDYDNDGYDDLAVSAYGHDTGGSGAGAVYLLFGPLADGEYDASGADIRLDGYASSQYFGYYLMVTGDVDGAGGDDLMVGAYYASSYTGYIALFTSFSADTLADEGAAIISGAGVSSYVGYGGALPGDLNGDGVPDVVYGEPGEDMVRLIYGPVAGVLDETAADLSYDNTADAGNYPGSRAAGGDLNGDGYVDLLLSSKYDDTGISSGGLVGVYYGPITATGTVDFDTYDATVLGAAASDNVGQNQDGITVADRDDDGLADLFLGVSNDDTTDNSAGSALLFYGPISGSNPITQYDQGFFGSVSYDYVGRQQVRLADLDGDRLLDPVFGGYGAGTAGEVYAFLGSGL